MPSIKLSVVLSVLILLLLTCRSCLGLAKFTNIQCLNMDANFSEFSQCRLRAVKRDVNELTLKGKFLPQVKPLKDFYMRWQLMKKASGYKPFLYDISVDVCEYLEKRNHPFLNIIFNTFSNHSAGFNKCPLNHEITLDHFRFPNKALVSIPLPMGEYALFATFGAGGKALAIIKLYFTLAEFQFEMLP